MGSTLWVPVIMAILSGGGIGAVVALRKLPAERDSIVVTAANGVLVMQSKVLDEMRTQIGAIEERAEACEAREQKLRGRVDELEREVGQLRTRPPESRTRSTDE